jgi:hypothetical protein
VAETLVAGRERIYIHRKGSLQTDEEIVELARVTASIEKGFRKEVKTPTHELSAMTVDDERCLLYANAIFES